jgi:tetrahydromethanopterin S-methyltransferase subunit F
VERDATFGAGVVCTGCEDVACGGDQDSALNCRNQRGMVSAEWAVGIIAAVAIAGVLLGIVTSGPVHDALLNFILMVIRSFSGFVK